MRSASDQIAMRDHSFSPPVIIRMPEAGPHKVITKLAVASVASGT
jgi:hypothetical protein